MCADVARAFTAVLKVDVVRQDEQRGAAEGDEEEGKKEDVLHSLPQGGQ